LDHIISWMIALPFIGALIQIFLSPRSLARWSALLTSLASSAFAFVLVFRMNPSTPGFQAKESAPWIGSFTISYDVGMDGLSLLPIVLIGLVFPLLIVAEWNQKKGVRGIQGLLLLLQTAFFGIVCSRDLFLLFFFWTLSAVPFYFLLSIWGDKEREKVAFRYMITSAFGNALFFIGIILIYFSMNPQTFSMAQDLIGDKLAVSEYRIFNGSVSGPALAYLLLLAGLALRIPIWPAHGWFSLMATQVPTSVAVAFCGVFVPVGIYVFTRISFTLFPGALFDYSQIIMILGVVNAVAGSLCAISQRELRLFIAYLCIAQVGFILMGVASLDGAGLIGAIFQGMTVGLGLTGLGLFSGLLKDRTGGSVFLSKKGLPEVGGLAHPAPLMALLTGVIFASILGIPGLGGFIGQSFIMMGGFSHHPEAVLIMGGSILILTYGLFSVYRNIFLGSGTSVDKESTDLSWRERMYFFPIVAALLLLGVYPNPLLALVKPTALTLLSIVK